MGDYTRLLGEACLGLGCECGVISLHDRHAPTLEQSELVTSAGSIPILRMPVTLPWPERAKKACEFRARFQPDWMSLQFVAYGFQDKGIPWNLARWLKPVIGKCPLQIMFHELWIGERARAPIRHRIVGKIQSLVILKMIRRLRPQMIHTSIPFYVGLLGNKGIEARTLPLFGNIPVASNADNSWLYDQLKATGCEVRTGSRENFWLAGFFGSLHEEWTPEPLFSILCKAAKGAKKRICFITAGRLGDRATAFWNQMASDYRNDFWFVNLGALTPERISQYFQTIDFGISANPLQLIGKSGSAAAMADHGLPIIVTREVEGGAADAERSGFFARSLLEVCDSGLESKLVCGLTKQPPYCQVGKIACQFLADLDE